MPASQSALDWHRRFEQQAGWTQHLRGYLFERAGIQQAHWILEVGCGTGVVLDWLQSAYPGRLVAGLDLDPEFLRLARRNNPASPVIDGDALALPFPGASFDIVCCHYFLLWVQNPAAVLLEMRRVTRPGGAILALAEPDYGGRVDYPAPLSELGQLQTQSLQNQGADPLMGRKLAALFLQAGLSQLESGVLGGQWLHPAASDPTGLEQAVLDWDLSGRVSPQQLSNLQQIDHDAWQSGERILYVPTFYAWGIV